MYHCHVETPVVCAFDQKKHRRLLLNKHLNVGVCVDLSDYFKSTKLRRKNMG